LCSKKYAGCSFPPGPNKIQKSLAYTESDSKGSGNDIGVMKFDKASERKTST
jgi:hypothetical protein